MRVKRRELHPLAIASFPKPVRYATYYAVIVAILLLGKFNNAPFIYFQF